MIRTHATIKEAKLARTKEGRRIIVQMEMPTNIDLEELWDLMDSTSAELTLQNRQLPLRPRGEEPVAEAAPTTEAAEPEAEPAEAGPGWYFRVIAEGEEPRECGPYDSEEEAIEASNILKEQTAEDGAPRFIEMPFLRETVQEAEAEFPEEPTTEDLTTEGAPVLYSEEPTVLNEHPNGETERQTIDEMLAEMEAATEPAPTGRRRRAAD